MHSFLVESALLTHGIKSISNEELSKKWISDMPNIAWVDKGRIVLGDIEEFIGFRNRSDKLLRINYQNLEEAQYKLLSGALTASGTMRVCEKENFNMAVTAGMGGLGNLYPNKKDNFSSDVSALSESSVILIATSPKDMFDIELTIETIKKNGRKVIGKLSDTCDGYIFAGKKVSLDSCYSNISSDSNILYLNEIKKENRIQDMKILEDAVEYGYEQVKNNQYFHPNVNEYIDRQTQGYSSIIQLESLLENIAWAMNIEGSKYDR